MPQKRLEAAIDKLSMRRLQENEKIFREVNYEIKDTISAVFEKYDRFEIPLDFFCECADLDCRDQIKIPVVEYEKCHAGLNHYIVLPNHFNKEIERIIGRQKPYWVVEKFPI